VPDELDRLAAAFGPNDLYASADLRAAYVSGDGTVTRLYVTTTTSPYDTKSFQTVRDLRLLLATDPGHFGAMVGETAAAATIQEYVGGPRPSSRTSRTQSPPTSCALPRSPSSAS